jgi:hypothetical protein
VTPSIAIHLFVVCGNPAITITDGTFANSPDNFFTGTPTYITILRLMNDGNGLPQPVPGISQLPNAAYALGQTKIVSDSTAIATQGQPARTRAAAR